MKNYLLLLTLVNILSSCAQENPKNKPFRLSVAQYYELAVKGDDLLKGIQYLDTALMIEPKNVDAYSLRGYLKAQSKNLKGAITDFNEVIKIDPQNPTAYSHRGICNKEIGNYKAALKDYDKAIALDKKNAHAYHNRAMLKYHFLSDATGACKDWEKAKRLGLVLAYQQSEGRCMPPNGKLFEMLTLNEPQAKRKAKYQSMVMTKSEFESLLRKNNILFRMPEGFEEIKVRANSNMPYQYAIKNKDADFEVRIYIESLTDMKKQFKIKGKQDQSINNVFESGFLSSLDNISQLQLSFLVYEAETVIPRFNGDIGLLSHFDYPENSEYGKGYKYGTFMIIHKDDVADIYLSFLYKQNNSDAVFRAAEKTLRFK